LERSSFGIDYRGNLIKAQNPDGLQMLHLISKVILLIVCDWFQRPLAYETLYFLGIDSVLRLIPRLTVAWQPGFKLQFSNLSAYKLQVHYLKNNCISSSDPFFDR
jgi:hypothetical protein